MLAGAFVGLTALILVGTFADHIPLLHKLPVVGAPKPKITFRVNGSTKCIVRLKADDDGAIQERRAELSIEVLNPSRFERNR